MDISSNFKLDVYFWKFELTISKFEFPLQI